ncbi:MAG: ATP-binding protein, partial [Bacteroidota bacterium]
FTVYETFDHQYFSGTPGGISVFNEKKEIWETPISATNSVYSLKHFSNDTLWGLSGAGLFKYCLPEEKMSLISKKPLNNSNILINDFIVDTKGLKWIGTQDGLFLYNQNVELIKDFYAADGLVNNTIKSIIEDREKKIWVATANGISCFEVTATNGEYEFAINNFNHFDGLMKDELLAGSVAQLPDGTMVWGGVDGINTVNPAELDGNEQHLLKPLFVNFYLAGIKVKQNQTFGNDTLLDKSITSTNRIKLDHNQNYVGFEVSACHYQNPGKTYYQYKMDGVDDSWRIMHPDKHTAFINYTNLSPGEYTLKVKASGIPHQWPDEYSSIEVIIQPPFYQTPWAYFTYLIVVLMMVIGVSVYIIRKNKQKSRRRQKTEIENLKQNFFINLSHDLKTPLTLILTPLESVLNNLEQNELKTKLSKIYYNANNLLQLVNQLLNFRKLEVYGDTLNLKYTPVGELIDSVVFGFKESSLTAETQFSYHNTLNELHAYVDKDKLVSIIYNLLTNAFKYTNQKVEISAILNEQSQISITISDDGCGIPQKERSRIFSRYYRMEKHHNSHSGTGIGLHVVKQYVELHEGRLMVDSSPDRGSSFTVLIPADMKTDNEILDVHNETSDSGRGQQILIIEDNNEFRDFLVNELSARYSVKAAVNGGDALKLLSGYHPDLIISDFFMPEMGGLEFCKRQKSNIQNSHIPVIIISAGSSEQMQIDCFSAGADAYITKPFNMNVLLARINNLLDQQRERQLLFRRSNVVQPGELTNSKIDKDLIKKAIDFIDNNLENPSFSVDLLSRELCMDRTGLYRKIKAITGQTPSDFIKVIRLKRASVLLEQGMSVSEVSVKVGFSSNSYFSKCFQAQFGIKPSKWEEHNLT